MEYHLRGIRRVRGIRPGTGNGGIDGQKWLKIVKIVREVFEIVRE